MNSHKVMLKAMRRLSESAGAFDKLPPAIQQLADAAYKVTGPLGVTGSYILIRKKALKGAALFENAADVCNTLERLDYTLTAVKNEECSVAYKRKTVVVQIGLDTDGRIFLDVSDSTKAFP